MQQSHPVHVAVGVIVNSRKQVLISRRHMQSHQGGLWEFPGGKVERNESLLQALNREFQEELGLTVHKAFPLLHCLHDYGDKTVLLDVWEITDYIGNAQGLEGQEVRWCALAELHNFAFPAANEPIVKCLQLPREIAITPRMDNLDALLSFLARLFREGVKAIQIRQKHLRADEYREWFKQASELADDAGVILLANAPLQDAIKLDASAIHLNTKQLMACQHRPVPTDIILSVSCHDLAQLQRAEKIHADLALLSPVAETGKYAAESALGWQTFTALRSKVSLPVYALGGLIRGQLSEARYNGAFGIAGISMFTVPP